MNIKELVKNHVVVNADKSEVSVSLDKVHEGEWELARKAEYKKEIYAIPDSELFLEVRLSRAGEYHSDYQYGKPTYELVEKVMTHVVSYPVVPGQEEKAQALKAANFDRYDETSLTPVYDGDWKSANKANYLETVYDIEGVLLKRTLIGNSDWTEFVEYEVVQKKEEDVVSFRKVKS